jgi:anti-sigma regulatory factor (Ser/Thr protein kinase)
MNYLQLKVPERVTDNFGNPINYFLDCVSKVNPSLANKIDFDFNNCKFTSPFIIGGLASIAGAEKQKGIDVSCSLNEQNENLAGYIKTICFPWGFDYTRYQLKELDEVMKPYHLKTYIPLVCFPTAKNDFENNVREKVISAINSILKNQLKLSGAILLAIYYLIDELTQNIVDHSESSKGILFAQFYQTKNYMDICISDYGKGLLRSYIDSGKHNPTSDEEALNFAISGKSTKDRAESRGFGISTSRKMLVEGLKGKFLIYSGRAFFVQNIEKEEIISLPEKYNYRGCYVALRIPILENRQFDFYKYVE